jgi:hypothetical protein
LAIREDAVRAAYDAAGLQITAFHPGRWSGVKSALLQQDAIVAVKQ